MARNDPPRVVVAWNQPRRGLRTHHSGPRVRRSRRPTYRPSRGWKPTPGTHDDSCATRVVDSRTLYSALQVLTGSLSRFFAAGRRSCDANVKRQPAGADGVAAARGWIGGPKRSPWTDWRGAELDAVPRKRPRQWAEQGRPSANMSARRTANPGGPCGPRSVKPSGMLVWVTCADHSGRQAESAVPKFRALDPRGSRTPPSRVSGSPLRLLPDSEASSCPYRGLATALPQ